MRLLTLFFTLLLVPTLALAVELTSFPDNITVTVTPLQKKYTTSEEVTVNVEFTNTTEKEIRFLVWGTPFEGRINADFFNIQLEDGSKIPYSGRLYKRGTPTESDYKILSPGESISIDVNLYDAYNLKETGNYSLQYTNKNKINKALNTVKKKSVISYFTLEDDGISRDFKRTPIYTTCSSSEKFTLDSALTKAEQLSKTARDDLKNTPTSLRSSASRSTNWFGDYNASRYAEVVNNFEKIYSATNSKTIGFDCGCTEPYFAYVYPNDPYNIYICSAFWEASLTGTDSKAGTIIHELSHFYAVASTDDHAYGQLASMLLADSNPDHAINNADSHEYFAENTPFLSMPTALAIYEAVDNSSLTWTTGGNQDFFGQEETSIYGGDAAQSGGIDANQYSSLKTSLGKSTLLSFYWKVSSELNNDYLEFRVNGVVVDSISGNVDWQQKTYNLRGENTIEWRYVKDGSVSSGSDAGWVDRVTTQELDDALVAPILPILLMGTK